MTTVLKTTALVRLTVIIFYSLLAFFLIKPLFAENSTTSADTRVKANIQQRIETRKGNLEARKEKIETRIASREAKIASRLEDRKEKIASRQAALKEKLQAFKDKRKAEIADRINTNLNRINQKQTEQMLKHLDKLSNILDKLENRINEGNTNIKDIGATKAATADAREVLANASFAVTEQSAKDYTIELTSESKVKKDAQTQRTNLHNDLVAVRKQVIESKQKVMEVIRIAKSGKDTKEATTSGQ